MFDAIRSDLRIGVVGAGLMGQGIAQIAAQAGITVHLFDNRLEAAKAARQTISEILIKLSEKGKITGTDASAAVERINVVSSLNQLADCHIIIEAIVEKLDVKRELFRQLESMVSKTCLLATNTSSLSVTEIAAGCTHPERVGGFHFFNPVPLMKIVEVIEGVRGEAWVGDVLVALAIRMGHKPVRAKDSPGFIVNHAGRGYLTEALRIVGEGIAEFSQVDDVLRAAGFKLGPFELLDLTGLDVSYPVMESIYNQYYQEPRYRPSIIARQRLIAGLLGRKSNEGFYKYVDGKKVVQQASNVASPLIKHSHQFWIGTKGSGTRDKILDTLVAAGVPIDSGDRPAADSLCVVLPIGQDATTAALSEGLDPCLTVGVDPLHIDGQITVMSTPLTSVEVMQSAYSAFAASCSPIVIHDSPGFVAQRVKAMIVNIGCDMAQQRIAAPSDIDLAVKMGLGYPQGPLEMGDSMGAETVLQILNELSDFYRDPRYRPSPWLIRRARLGVSLLTPENSAQAHVQ